jgi:hypothetical protein
MGGAALFHQRDEQIGQRQRLGAQAAMLVCSDVQPAFHQASETWAGCRTGAGDALGRRKRGAIANGAAWPHQPDSGCQNWA